MFKQLHVKRFFETKIGDIGPNPAPVGFPGVSISVSMFDTSGPQWFGYSYGFRAAIVARTVTGGDLIEGESVIHRVVDPFWDSLQPYYLVDEVIGDQYGSEFGSGRMDAAAAWVRDIIAELDTRQPVLNLDQRARMAMAEMLWHRGKHTAAIQSVNDRLLRHAYGIADTTRELAAHVLAGEPVVFSGSTTTSFVPEWYRNGEKENMT